MICPICEGAQGAHIPGTRDWEMCYGCKGQGTVRPSTGRSLQKQKDELAIHDIAFISRIKARIAEEERAEKKRKK